MTDNRIHAASDIGEPRFDSAWKRAKDGPLATVYCGLTFLIFGDPRVARALAAECVKAADALDALTGAPAGTVVVQEGGELVVGSIRAEGTAPEGGQ